MGKDGALGYVNTVEDTGLERVEEQVLLGVGIGGVTVRGWGWLLFI